MPSFPRRPLPFLLVLLLVWCGSGCGTMRLRSEDVESVQPWPRLERIVAGKTPDGKMHLSGPAGRPTVLVRISLDDVPRALVEEREPLLHLRFYQALFHSGLFHGVAYQYGTDSYTLETDYVVDVLMRNKEEQGWYTYVGAVTLGILPFGVRQRYSVQCRVQDRSGGGAILGSVQKEDGYVDVYWLPFLPLNMAFSAIDLLGIGTALGLSKEGWQAKEKAVRENLMRATVVEVERLIVHNEEAKNTLFESGKAPAREKKTEPPEPEDVPSPLLPEGK